MGICTKLGVHTARFSCSPKTHPELYPIVTVTEQAVGEIVPVPERLTLHGHVTRFRALPRLAPTMTSRSSMIIDLAGRRAPGLHRHRVGVPAQSRPVIRRDLTVISNPGDHFPVDGCPIDR
jgi:hypothetical protein